jgi:hypothetical protein
MPNACLTLPTVKSPYDINFNRLAVFYDFSDSWGNFANNSCTIAPGLLACIIDRTTATSGAPAATMLPTLVWSMPPKSELMRSLTLIMSISTD